MKKVAILIILVLIAAVAYADYGLLDINGDHWMEMSLDQKEHYIAGILTGFEIVRLNIAGQEDTYDVEVVDDMLALENYLNLEMRVTDVISMLNRFYKPRENRYLTVWSTLMSETGKEWW